MGLDYFEKKYFDLSELKIWLANGYHSRQDWEGTISDNFLSATYHDGKRAMCHLVLQKIEEMEEAARAKHKADQEAYDPLQNILDEECR